MADYSTHHHDKPTGRAKQRITSTKEPGDVTEANQLVHGGNAPRLGRNRHKPRPDSPRRPRDESDRRHRREQHEVKHRADTSTHRHDKEESGDVTEADPTRGDPPRPSRNTRRPRDTSARRRRRERHEEEYRATETAKVASEARQETTPSRSPATATVSPPENPVPQGAQVQPHRTISSLAHLFRKSKVKDAGDGSEAVEETRGRSREPQKSQNRRVSRRRSLSRTRPARERTPSVTPVDARAKQSLCLYKYGPEVIELKLIGLERGTYGGEAAVRMLLNATIHKCEFRDMTFRIDLERMDKSRPRVLAYGPQQSQGRCRVVKHTDSHRDKVGLTLGADKASANGEKEQTLGLEYEMTHRHELRVSLPDQILTAHLGLVGSKSDPPSSFNFQVVVEYETAKKLELVADLDIDENPWSLKKRARGKRLELDVSGARKTSNDYQEWKPADWKRNNGTDTFEANPDMTIWWDHTNDEDDEGRAENEGNNG